MSEQWRKHVQAELEKLLHFVQTGCVDERGEGSAMYTVRIPKTPVPVTQVVLSERNGVGGWTRHWGVFEIIGEPGVNYLDSGVVEVARTVGIVVEYGDDGPLALQIVDSVGSSKTEEEIVAEAAALGLTVAKLPDTCGSPYYRWYVVREMVADTEPFLQEIEREES
jgi:hypothetical protein